MLKTRYFAYFSGQWGGSSPLPPPALAMLLHTTHPYTSVQPKILLKEGVWILKFFCLKNAWNGWRSEQSAAIQSSDINGGLGAKPLSLSDFLIFQKKNNYFNAIRITFRTFLAASGKVTLLSPFNSYFTLK